MIGRNAERRRDLSKANPPLQSPKTVVVGRLCADRSPAEGSDLGG